jgi:hypothetical protein
MGILSLLCVLWGTSAVYFGWLVWRAPLIESGGLGGQGVRRPDMHPFHGIPLIRAASIAPMNCPAANEAVASRVFAEKSDLSLLTPS